MRAGGACERVRCLGLVLTRAKQCSDTTFQACIGTGVMRRAAQACRQSRLAVTRSWCLPSALIMRNTSSVRAFKVATSTQCGLGSV